jgi:hypothetical protein
MIVHEVVFAINLVSITFLSIQILIDEIELVIVMFPLWRYFVL